MKYKYTIQKRTCVGLETSDILVFPLNLINVPLKAFWKFNYEQMKFLILCK